MVAYFLESKSLSSSLESLEWELRFRILVTGPRKDTDLFGLPSVRDAHGSGAGTVDGVDAGLGLFWDMGREISLESA